MNIQEFGKMRRAVSDLLRVVALMGVAGWFLYLADPANAVVFQAMGIAVFLVGGTHLTRRILFSRLDLQQIASKAINESNLPAAVVFASIVVFLVAVMHLSLSVFK